MNVKQKKRNPWKERKTKTKWKKISSNQLHRLRDQFSTNEIESASSYGTLVETLNDIRNNKFDKDLEKIVITNSSTTDQQPGHFFIAEPVSLEVSERKVNLYQK